MEKEQVVFISDCIEKTTSTIFNIEKLDTTVKNFLPGFQKGKEAISGFEVTKQGTNTSYRFVFINNGDYYLVIYSPNKKAIAELKQIEVIDGDPHLVWKYNPLKRDGKNQERKDYYLQNFGSSVLQIKLPKSSGDVEMFFNQFFTLCQNRQEADQLGEYVK